MSKKSVVPSSSDEVLADLTVVAGAIERAQRRILADRRADGSWVAYCDFGPAATAQVLVGLRFIDRLDPRQAKEAVSFLKSQQQSDGSFGVHPFAARGDIGATACAWAGLVAAGLSPEDPAVARARAFVDQAGGLPALLETFAHGDLSVLFLAMMKLAPAEALPAPNLLFALAPPIQDFLERRFNVLMPITLLQVGLILRFLRGETRSRFSPSGILAALQARRCLQIMDAFQNHDGSWFYGDTYHAALGLATLRAIGRPMDEPRSQRALGFLAEQARPSDHGSWYSIFNTDVWPTAFALRALLLSGMAPGNEAVARAADWLVSAEIPVPAKSRGTGGGTRDAGTWSFQSGNQTMPDADDVAVVLGPLGMAIDATGADRLNAGVAARVRPCIERGTAWLAGMQNPDGGWPAFQHGLPGKKPGPMMTGPMPIPTGSWLDKLRFFWRPPAELGDPSTEDVTGRVLHGLGQLGYTGASPMVERAIAFLRAQQGADGSFWGRWVVNYLAGTAWVLRGLGAVGVPPSEPWVERAIAFLLSRQNADGGWGEDVLSYADPVLAGRGASTPGLTGLVLCALVETGQTATPAAEAAVRYLLSMQTAEGSWPNENLLHALVPPSLFYVLPGTELQLPLEALGRYRAARLGTFNPRLPDSETDATRARADLVHPEVAVGPLRDARGRWSEEAMKPLVFQGDPLADAVIDELLADGKTDAVNDLMVRLVRMSTPVPEQLPPLTRTYFETSAKLPPWFDAAKIAKAQAMFFRHGWAVSAVLFCSSLPQCYAFPIGARVLLYTQGTSRHAWRRIVETAQLVFDVAEEGGLGAGGRGLRSTQKVRLMHAAIRHLVQQQASWDSASSLPINQIELCGTLCAFSVLVVDGLERLGCDVTKDEADAWIHLWNVVGHVIGTRPELMPKDYADGQALFAMLRTHWGESPQGKELTRATLELMRELLPGTYLDGFPSALVRHLAGDRCADLLGVPRADVLELFVKMAVELDEAFDFADRLGLASKLAQRASFDLMKALHGWAREGKEVQFRIPEALIRHWDGQR